MRRTLNSYIKFKKPKVRNKLESLSFINVEAMIYKMFTYKWSRLSIWYLSNVMILLILLVKSPTASAYSQKIQKHYCDKSEVLINCTSRYRPNYRLSIISAEFGSSELDCGKLTHNQGLSGLRDMSCSLPSNKVFQKLKAMCEGNVYCKFEISGPLFEEDGNNCFNTKGKFLNLEYECKPLEPCNEGLRSIEHLETFQKNDEEKHVLNHPGMWMRNPEVVKSGDAELGDTNYIYFLPLSTGLENLWAYENTYAMQYGKAKTFQNIPSSPGSDGTGMVVIGKYLYYNKKRTRTIARFRLGGDPSNGIHKELFKANYGNTSPYYAMVNTDIDFNVDETGLWVVYATEENNGNIVLSKIDREDLSVMESHNTPYDKMAALNAFMACGVMYVVNGTSLKIDYMYNITSRQGQKVNVDIPNLVNTTTSIKYSHLNHHLYVWDRNGYASLYKVNFNHQDNEEVVSSVTTSTPAKPDPTQSLMRTTTIDVGYPLYCESVSSQGFEWARVAVGQSATVACPGSDNGGTGHATWKCTAIDAKTATFSKGGANFEYCISDWLVRLSNEVTQESVVDKSKDLERQLQTKKLILRPWDIVATIDLLNKILDSTEDKKLLTANEIADNFVKIADVLLDENLEEKWNQLNERAKREQASRIIQVMDRIGRLLFSDISPGVHTLPYTSKLQSTHVKLEMETQKQLDFNKADFRPNAHTHVHFESSDPKGQLTGMLVVAFHKRLGSYMTDQFSMGSLSNYPVDSELISVTSISEDDKSKSNERVKIKFDGEIFSKVNIEQSCAFWNVTSVENIRTLNGRWSPQGCATEKLQDGGVTCTCDHATTFAVLTSKVGNFPLSWQKEMSTVNPTPGFPSTSKEIKNGDEVKIEAVQFEGLSIIRVGLVFSILIQMVVIVTLLFYSHKLDSNTIHKNIVSCSLVTGILFAFFVNQTANNQWCSMVSVLLHIGILSSACWSTLSCYHLMSDQGENKRYKMYYFVGYGAPILCVVITAAIDKSVYDGKKMCWVDPGTSSIYGVVVPLLVAVVISVCCVVVVLKNLKSPMSSARSHLTHKRKSLRRMTQQTCFIYALMAAKWSSLIPWMSSNSSQIVTAWLFCVFTIIYSLACLVCFCILDEKVRSKCCKWLHHIKKDQDFSHRHHHHPVGPDGRRRPFGVNDGQINPNSGYPLHNVRTTLQSGSSNGYPVNTCTESPTDYRQPLSSTSTHVAPRTHYGDEITRPLMQVATSSCASSLQHCDLIASCHGIHGAAAVPCCHGNCQRNRELDGKFHQQRYSNNNSNSWNNYVQGGPVGHRTTIATSNGGQQVQVTLPSPSCNRCRGNDIQGSTHYYEQPRNPTSTGPMCSYQSKIISPTSTVTSVHPYDHLHQQDRFAPQQQRQRCRCGPPQLQSTSPPHSTCSTMTSSKPGHLYETLGPFRSTDETSPIQQQPMDDSVGRDFHQQVRRQSLQHQNVNYRPPPNIDCDIITRHPSSRFHYSQHRTLPEDSRHLILEEDQLLIRGDPHRHHPSRVMTTSFGHDHVMSQHASRDVLLAAGPSFHGHHLGGGVRHGNKYGQHHHGNLIHHQQQGSGRSSDPLSTDQGYDTDSCQQLQFGRHPVTSSSSNQQRRKENVAMTSSANSSRTTEDDESSENDLEVEKINRHNEALLSPADSESMIETARGGRLSGTDTVTSWAAVKPPKSNSHHHFDHQENHHQVVQHQRHSHHFGGTSQLPSSYTLPETSESATKAKIDLRAGGVNMITNL